MCSKQGSTNFLYYIKDGEWLPYLRGNGQPNPILGDATGCNDGKMATAISSSPAEAPLLEVSLGEQDFCPLPPSKGAGPAIGLLKPAPALQTDMEDRFLFLPQNASPPTWCTYLLLAAVQRPPASAGPSTNWHWPDAGSPSSSGAADVLYSMSVTPSTSTGAQCWC